MKRHIRRLRLEVHEEYGNLGLKPLWMPGHQSDPLTGMGVAHDILEHGSHDVCEWQGLGGSVFVRAENGYFGRGHGNPDPVENIASDFVDLFRLWEGATLPTPRRKLRVQRDEENTYQMITEVVTKGAELVRTETRYSHDAEQRRSARNWTNAEQRERMRQWMLLGYRACAHRWRLVSQYMVYETFLAIEREVDTFITHNADYVGVDCSLAFDLRANVRINLDEEEYGADE